MFAFRKVPTEHPEIVAAVDLGSNSFHMIVAKVVNGQLQIVDKLREMVRLGAGLQDDKTLTEETQAKALDCLERFGQRLRALPQGSVRVAGTNTLRQARADAFLRAGEVALGHPIEIIAGREEARLVYLGIAHGLAGGDQRRLVVDIGGGSTELIVGQDFSPTRRESMHMGCVSMTRDHFDDGGISKKRMKRAVLGARLELTPVKARFNRGEWDGAVGSSGTIRAIRNVVTTAGWCERGISMKALIKLRDALVEAGHERELKLEGITDDRRAVFAGGVAVLLGVFKSLDIKLMAVSDEAMREGLLYDLLGRIQHSDVRSRTVETLADRYKVDQDHAARVEQVAIGFLNAVAETWDIQDEEHSNMLAWAARLHESGLTVSHSQYQKHGAYLLENSDMSGFSRQEQAILATLVRGHRRKLHLSVFESLVSSCVEPTIKLCVLLRLAVLIHRSRVQISMPEVGLSGKGTRLELTFPEGWLDKHPLTRADIKRERCYLKEAGYRLKVH